MSNHNDEQAEIINRVVQKIRDAQNKTFTFLLIGKTGVGKSSTINSLLGEEIAKTGKFKPTTMEVKRFDGKIKGINFFVYDTPGLCDDLPEAGNDINYINTMIGKINRFDCMLYVTELDETRVTSDELRSIKLITEAFGNSIWRQTVIVFTKEDKVPPGRIRRIHEVPHRCPGGSHN